MTRLTVAAGVLLALSAGALSAQGNEFHWSGALHAGQTLEIKGVNGDVHAVAATGADARVTADKSARRSDPASVKIEVVHGNNGITICAVYPTPSFSTRRNTCEPGSGGHMSTHNNDVRVDFDVHVPTGVRLVARTVNGDVDARGLTGDVNAYTVNGGVKVSTNGTARASTVNGSVDLDMGRADWSGDMSVKTVNGSVTVAVPQGAGLVLDARTVNGSIESDFPLTIEGRISPRHLRATLGGGGRTLEMSTVNGDIRLRKRGG